MKWRGETVEQFWVRVSNWHQAFAYFPKQMESGEWLWLEPYVRRSKNIGPTRLDIVWERHPAIPAEE